jgi:Domain of unknown function (DUF1737)
MDKAYIVIDESSATKVAEKVNYYMVQGYVPVGGIAVSIAPGGWMMWAQAMVKGA